MCYKAYSIELCEGISFMWHIVIMSLVVVDIIGHFARNITHSASRKGRVLNVQCTDTEQFYLFFYLLFFHWRNGKIITWFPHVRVYHSNARLTHIMFTT